jgi:hypothetical protein
VIRRISLCLTLALVAVVVSLVVAPQMVLVSVWLLPPQAALVAQELGLWGSGLAACIVARRLGWSASFGEALAVLVAPLLGELATAAMFGALPAAYHTVPAAVLRVLAAAGAIALLHRLRR